MSSGISHKNIDVMDTKDQDDTYQSFFRHHLWIMLEEWKLEHFFHVRMTVGEIRKHLGFYGPIAEYMEQLENGNVWLYLIVKTNFFVITQCH